MPAPPLIQKLPSKIAARVTLELRAKRFRSELPEPIEHLAKDIHPPLLPADLRLLRAAIAGCEKFMDAYNARKMALNKQKNKVRVLRRKLLPADAERSTQFFLTKKGIARLQAIFLYSFAMQHYGVIRSDAALKLCANIVLFSKHPNRTAFSSKEISKQAEVIRGRFRTLMEGHQPVECKRAGECLWGHVQRLAALPGASWQGEEVTGPNVPEDTEPHSDASEPSTH